MITFGDAAAVFLYSVNVFLISVFQNFIWDHADGREGYVNRERLHPEFQSRLRLMLNLDMVNGLIALAVSSFFYPRLAFFLLFFKLPALVFGAFYIGRKRRAGLKEKRKKRQSLCPSALPTGTLNRFFRSGRNREKAGKLFSTFWWSFIRRNNLAGNMLPLQQSFMTHIRPCVMIGHPCVLAGFQRGTGYSQVFCVCQAMCQF